MKLGGSECEVGFQLNRETRKVVGRREVWRSTNALSRDDETSQLEIGLGSIRQQLHEIFDDIRDEIGKDANGLIAKKK